MNTEEMCGIVNEEEMEQVNGGFDQLPTTPMYPIKSGAVCPVCREDFGNLWALNEHRKATGHYNEL